MADGTNIPLVKEDRGADAGHDGANPKGRSSFGLDNGLRSTFTLILKLGVAEMVRWERFVDGDAADRRSRPCCNLRVSVHAQYVNIN